MFDKIAKLLQNQSFKIVVMVVFILAVIILLVIAGLIERKNSGKTKSIKKMVTISILSALSVVLYYFIRIPASLIFPFMPPFFKIHFSSIPVYIGGYLFGPISGSIIVIIRFIAKLPGSSSIGVGELSDLIIGLVTVLVSSIIYHKKKTKSSAIVATSSIVIIWTIVAIISNWLFIIPIYISLYGFDNVLGLLNNIPGITADNYMFYYILIGVIPFNLILSVIVSIVTFFTYKRLSNLYKVTLDK